MQCAATREGASGSSSTGCGRKAVGGTTRTSTACTARGAWNVPRRTTRRVPTRVRQPLAPPPVLHQPWALDFMTETLYDGRRIRLLTILDEGTREALDIAMGVSLPSRRVGRVLNELVAVHGRPSAVRVDNGLPQKSRRQSFSDLTTGSVDFAARRQAVSTVAGITR